MSIWTDFVKEFSKKHNVSYKDAMSSAKCKTECNLQKVNKMVGI
jgi:hypothetical protein